MLFTIFKLVGKGEDLIWIMTSKSSSMMSEKNRFLRKIDGSPIQEASQAHKKPLKYIELNFSKILG
jgi:hypothetical protein